MFLYGDSGLVLRLVCFCTIVLGCGEGEDHASSPASTHERRTEIPVEVEERFNAEFLSIRGVIEVDGGVLVADGDAEELQWISAADAAPVVRGRLGSGPNEYRSLTALYRLAGDTSVLYDSRARRVTFLAGTEFLGRFEPIIGGLVGADTLGNWLVGSRFRSAAIRGITTDSAVFWKFNHENGRTDTIARLGGGTTTWSIDAQGLRRMTSNLLDPADRILMFPDGWVALVFADPYRVDWLTADGDSVAGAPIQIPREPVDEALKTAFRERHGLTAAVAERMTWPEILPPFSLFAGPWRRRILSPQGLVVATPNGNVLVRRTVFLPGTDSVRYDLIDRSGSLTGYLRVAENEFFLGPGQRSMFLAHVYESGVQELRRIRWP